MATYSIVSVETQSITRADGSRVNLVWRVIPRDCADTMLRGMRPGKFARHPEADVVYVLKGGRIDPWETAT